MQNFTRKWFLKNQQGAILIFHQNSKSLEFVLEFGPKFGACQKTSTYVFGKY
jgi:hypothetical protein